MNLLDEIKFPVREEVDRFHQLFLDLLEPQSEWLGEAIEQLAKAKGKQLRPILVTLLGRMLIGRVEERTLLSAVLLELIHTATLIHDDVIDSSLVRRKKPTLNARFDNRVAVLMGDYVLSSALMAAVGLQDLRVMSLVSSLGRELSEGEIRQHESAEELIIEEANYLSVIYQKTAVLFNYAAQIAGITTEQSEEVITRLASLGTAIGMAFQIRDDIFDYRKDDVGKPTGHDIQEGKVTLPLIYALDRASLEARRVMMALIEQPELGEDEVSQLLLFAQQEGGLDYAEGVMMRYLEEAKEVLMTFPDNEYRASLLLLIEYIGKRTY